MPVIVDPQNPAVVVEYTLSLDSIAYSHATHYAAKTQVKLFGAGMESSSKYSFFLVHLGREWNRKQSPKLPHGVPKGTEYVLLRDSPYGGQIVEYRHSQRGNGFTGAFQREHRSGVDRLTIFDFVPIKQVQGYLQSRRRSLDEYLYRDVPLPRPELPHPVPRGKTDDTSPNDDKYYSDIIFDDCGSEVKDGNGAPKRRKTRKKKQLLSGDRHYSGGDGKVSTHDDLEDQVREILEEESHGGGDPAFGSNPAQVMQ